MWPDVSVECIVTFSSSVVNEEFAIDIPEDRKPRLHRGDIFRFGWMCCASVRLLAPILQGHGTVCGHRAVRQRDAVSGLWRQLTKSVAPFNVMD
jgi:hypothetical protein